MKKTLFTNASVLVLLILAFTACKKQEADVVLSANTEQVTAAKGQSNTYPVVSLRVTVNDAAGYNITSDGKEDYVNGLDNVQAVLDQYGTFAFNTLNSNKPNTIAKRWVIYNFNNPVDPNNTYRPSPSNSMNYHFSTGGSPYGTNPFIPLQNLGINGNSATECIYMGNGMANSTTAWRVSFHKGLEDILTSPTAFAVVTRVNATQWTITPMGSCSPNTNVASLRNNADNTLYGYYNLPFSFTLTAQP